MPSPQHSPELWVCKPPSLMKNHGTHATAPPAPRPGEAPSCSESPWLESLRLSHHSPAFLWLTCLQPVSQEIQQRLSSWYLSGPHPTLDPHTHHYSRPLGFLSVLLKLTSHPVLFFTVVSSLQPITSSTAKALHCPALTASLL